MKKSTNRRSFIQTVAMGTVASLSIPQIVSAAISSNPKSKKISLNKDDVILFQGDSITDWGRDKKNTDPNDFLSLGHGYVLLAASKLLRDNPDKNLQIYNRGISGNKVFQLADRWDTDCIALKPNVISIMIGVNDYWHTQGGVYTGTIDTYRTDYKKLMDRTKQALPNAKFIIIEPFGVKGVKAVTDSWYPAFNEYRQAAHDISEQYDTAFIPSQSIFDKAQELAPGSYWTADGVHPSIAGAELLSHAYLEMIK